MGETSSLVSRGDHDADVGHMFFMFTNIIMLMMMLEIMTLPVMMIMMLWRGPSRECQVVRRSPQFSNSEMDHAMKKAFKWLEEIALSQTIIMCTICDHDRSLTK
eukprot:2625633-Karenia_brevis.AAC.1